MDGLHHYEVNTSSYVRHYIYTMGPCFAEGEIKDIPFRLTLKLLQFWCQNGVNILLLVLKSLEVTSSFISKLMKRIARWRHHWNIWHLSVKTKISPLFGCYQVSNGCQQFHKKILQTNLLSYCSNIQQKLKKLCNSTKNQSFLMPSGGFLKFIQFWLNIRAIT